jgi:hypothetical protein
MRPKLKLTVLALAIFAGIGGGAYLWKQSTSVPVLPAQEEVIAPDTAPSQPSPSDTQVVAATPAAAKDALAAKYDGPDTSLIQRLMPASEIRGVDKLDFGLGTYVWEIDMLADKANPQSSGFVYLSADGTKLLNGPMMDKRSRVMPLGNVAEGTAPSPAPLPETSHHTAEQVMPESSADANQEQAFNPQPALEAQAKKAAYQRDQFYSGISQLNYISTTQGSNVVYVLFDPLCAACGRLYKQSTAIAAAYDVEFRWIPIFLNEKSYPIAALIQKIHSENQTKGLETLDQVLTKQWKAEDHLMEIAGLTEADYEQVKPAGAVFYEIGRAVPGIGTPFVMFKNADNKVEAFGGVPLATDWASLKKK